MAYTFIALILAIDIAFLFQDTVIGLQALSEYSIRTNIKDVNLQVAFLIPGQNDRNDKKFNVTNENAQVVRVVEGLYNGNGVTNLTVRVVGTGSALLAIDMSYNVFDDGKQCPFNMSDIAIEDLKDKPVIDRIIAEKRGCDVCGSCNKDEDAGIELDDDDNFEIVEIGPKAPDGNDLGRRRRASGQPPANQLCVRFDISSDRETDMAIVRFDLQTGVTIIKSDLVKLMKNQPSIDRYELPEQNRGYIIFYLNSIGPIPVEFVFRLSDSPNADQSTRQMAKIDVYEYYKTERICTKFYDVGAQAGKPIPYECNVKANRNCVCLQNICAKNYAVKYKNMVKRGGKPVLSLQYRLCETDNADYAVLVELGKPVLEPNTRYMLVTGTVKQVIHKGLEKLRPGSEMSFKYKAPCQHPNIKQSGEVYYVIGKTGYKIPGKDSYQYELMDPAIVIKKTNKRPLKGVMKAFEKIMKKGCHV